jgi:molybdopterin-biosynthesis enzyme MoeA-like protein
MSSHKFFIIIIGTEILNRRREDAHFEFMTTILKEHNHKLSGSFIIEDDPKLIVDTIKFISDIPNSVIFSFGGIGSTPDDYTRESASKALRDGKLYLHEEAKAIIEERLKDKAYPHPINMAKLPKGAKLLHNPINKMPAFYLDDRFFFMAGFPQMSHPMVEYILNNIIKDGKITYRKTLTAKCRENIFIELMREIPSNVEVSSLPSLKKDGSFTTTISVNSDNTNLTNEIFSKFINILDKNAIDYYIE